MNVLITGGSGLIAGRLALYIKNMCNVTLASRKNISPIENVKMITANKLDSKDLLSQDIIIHTASPNDKQCNDKKIREKYLNDTKTLIENAKECNVKKFIFTSSTRVYGSRPNRNITEQSSLSIDDNYSLVKKEIEDYLEEISSSDLSSCSLRISNGYGYPVLRESQCWSLVVMYACKQAFIDNKIVLRSNGEEYKDFIPISSVIETINNFINVDFNHRYQMYNVTSGNTEKVKNILNNLIDRIYILYKKQVQLVLSNGQEKYPAYQIRNNLNAVNCSPSINHNQEIDMLIKYCQKNYQ